MKYVSRYLNGDVPRVFPAKLTHTLVTEPLSPGRRSLSQIQIGLSHPILKQNNPIKRRKPKIRSYKHVTGKITRPPVTGCGKLAVPVLRTAVNCGPVSPRYYPSGRWLSSCANLLFLMKCSPLKKAESGHGPFPCCSSIKHFSSPRRRVQPLTPDDAIMAEFWSYKKHFLWFGKMLQRRK